MKKIFSTIKRGANKVVKEVKDGIKYILNLGDKELKMKIASDILIAIGVGVGIGTALISHDLRSASVAA